MNQETLFDTLKRAKKLHFIGIGGISMSSVAMFARFRGYEVTGSDRSESAATARLRENGIRVYATHKAENIGDADAVVYTAAVTMENPEMHAASSRGIPLISRAQFLGYIMCSYPNRIGISGTHGKSTTSSMVAHIFLTAGKDPTVALGAELQELGGAYRIGQGEDFIYESCEYKDSFLSFYPDVAVILNIDHDHVDYFFTMEQMEQSFAKSILSAHTVIAPGADVHVERALAGYQGRIIRFGMERDNDVYPDALFYERGKACFDIVVFGERLCHVCLAVPGAHNVLDALAAAAAAYVSGIGGASIGEGLGCFCGAKRRFERKGTFRGADVYDDYAHHPAEIKATLSGVSGLGYRKVFCVFQPHTYSRTAELFDEFAHAFTDADQVVFADIYSAREVNTFGITSADLAAAVEGAVYFDSFEKITEYLRDHVHAGDLVLTMGAGDVYKISEMLIGEGT